MRKWIQPVALLLALAMPGSTLQAFAYSPDTGIQRGLTLKKKVSVPNGNGLVTFRLRDVTIAEALQLIAEQKKLSLTIDDSISDAQSNARLNLDFYDTPLNQVLEAIIFTNGLDLQTMGSTYIVYRSGRYGKSIIRYVPLTYANASSLANLITNIMDDDKPDSATGSSSGAQGATGSGAKDLFATKVRPDVQSNGLILSGQEENVKIVEQLAQQMDVHQPSRIFPLNNLAPTEAIDILRASFFQRTGPSGGAAGGAAGGGTSGGAGAAAGSSGGQPSGETIQSKYVDFAGTPPGQLPQTKTESVVVAGQTPRFVPLSRQNAILVVGPQPVLTLVEQILVAVDRKAPQVMIRTQIVEIEQGSVSKLGLTQSIGAKQLGFDSALGQFTFDTLRNQAANLRLSLDALITQRKAKILASPSVLAMDNRSSVIKITDDIIETAQSQITTPQVGPAIITRTITKGEVGITLEITPRIDSQGNITMNVHPTISYVKDVERSAATNDIVATLKSTREYRTQEIRVRDGDTIVIGGLIQNRGTQQNEKIPLLGDIPLIGALFQRTNSDQTRTELQIFITPEIIKDAGV